MRRARRVRWCGMRGIGRSEHSAAKKVAAWWTGLGRPRQRVVAALVCVGLVMACASGFMGGDWWGLLANLGSEGIGAVVIYLLIEQGVDRDEAVRKARDDAEARHKAQIDELVADMGSADNGTALTAVTRLRQRGQLFDGTLQHRNFADANLSGAKLVRAKMAGARLTEARLVHANLFGADLCETDLTLAKLVGADLGDADLRGATLRAADLTHAILLGTDLRGADLTRATLTEASVQVGGTLETKMDAATTLPDGSRWSEGRTLSEFSAFVGEVEERSWVE